MPYKSKESRAACNARYYKQNKERLNDKSKQWAKQNPERAREINRKSAQKKRDYADSKKTACVVCGWFEHPSAIDFHHVNPEEKSFELAMAANFSIKAIDQEIDKCVCLCANCHRMLHAGAIELP